MRNYIILNGVKSTAYCGLLIQNLPNITMPQIRTKVETIDGRDGDIITRLGYAAYDKVVTIGLLKDVDVNKIIAYFTNNNSGTVTFSNEPDLYYNYQINEAINFERLIRFKQAAVTFHVQPFKYMSSEGYLEYSVKSNSEIPILNSGNVYSKPTLTVTGSGNCYVYLNNSQIFKLELGTNEQIIIDTAAMEAYNSNRILKNRIVTGNYDNFYLPIGASTIKLTGSVTKFSISKYSRWI